MASSESAGPRVFVDADVLFAGSASASQHGASLVILRMAEITLIKALTSEQAVVEAERNLAAKLPKTLPIFRLLVSRSLQVLPNPAPVALARYAGLADHKDLPILVAAIEAGCPWLVTFNLRHYSPGHPDVRVTTPGRFVQHVRYLLAGL